MTPKDSAPYSAAPPDMKQACLDLSNAAIALFDLIDADGVQAPLDGIAGVMKLKAVVDAAEEIRSYYERRNIQRLLALGVSPAELLRMGNRG